MLISGFFRNNNVTRELPPPPNEFRNLKLRGQLTKDTVAFSGHKFQTIFNTRREALDYYRNIGASVNKSLEEEDDLTAFETLGYKVDSDFDTDKITINGDYNPRFPIYLNRGQHLSGKIVRARGHISYDEAGIDEKRLMQNVEKVTGQRYAQSSFEPDDDFVIDKSVIYPEKVGERLDNLMQTRAKAVQKALDERKDEEALNILGYKTSSDENGNITIEGDYSAIAFKSSAGTKTIDSYGIDEMALLSHVTEIKGNATFLNSYTPDHYIKLEKVSTTGSQYLGDDRRIRESLAKYHPDLRARVKAAKEAMETGDNLSALQILGHNAEQDKDGGIILNEDYYSRCKGAENHIFTHSELGIDDNELLANVRKVNGLLDLWHSPLEIINEDMEVTGFVYCPDDRSSLFENFTSAKEVSLMYEGMTPEIIRNFAKYGALSPTLRTPKNCYFRAVEGENKEFLDGIDERRSEILTSEELQQKYGVAKRAIDNRLKKGELVPYGVSVTDKSDKENSAGFMFDIKDETNMQGLKSLEKRHQATVTQREWHSRNTVSQAAFENACLRNQVKCQGSNSSTSSYPASALEAFGYGTKADIMSHCGLRMNSYELRHYILDNDRYNITNAEVEDALKNARKNNPAFVSLSELQKRLGSERNAFREAVVEDKINIITQHPYRLTNPNDYAINLADKKNQEFLSTVDNDEFQSWYQARLEAHSAYRKRNDEALEQFKTQKPPTKAQRQAAIEREYRELERQRKEAASAERTRAKKAKEDHRQNTSLRNTIAWVLCPATRQIKRENSNAHLGSIFLKYQELEHIQNAIMANEITEEEAEKEIAKLGLKKEDEKAVNYYNKMCWNIAGTQEWSSALRNAKPIMEQYKAGGIDSIEDEAIRERLLQWEKEHPKK